MGIKPFVLRKRLDDVDMTTNEGQNEIDIIIII